MDFQRKRKNPLNPTPATALRQISLLVRRFQANSAYYHSASYHEADVRSEFIDQFLIALGWDVHHQLQTLPGEQEVRPYRSSQDPLTQRRADYALSLTPHFDRAVLYIEAKRPGEELATAESYFQVIRYARQLDHPLAILTNFSQWHVIDCRQEVRLETALQRGVARYDYRDFADRVKFAEFFQWFSRPAVAGGSLARYTASLPRCRARIGQQSFTARLLGKLHSLGQKLLKGSKRTSPQWSCENRHIEIQQILERLILIRFLEDKQIEPEPVLPTLGTTPGHSAWQDFITTCHRLNSKYSNLGFELHTPLDIPTGLSIDETLFRELLTVFDYRSTPYLLSDVSLPILGAMYKQSLDRKPATLAHKASGVFYTPDDIVNHIVHHTVGKLIAGKQPGEITQMRFIDISCGCGAFLLGIYMYLIQYVTRWYHQHPTQTPPDALTQTEDGPRLSLTEKSRILLDNIYGVDLDPKAIEIAKRTLLLALFDEPEATSASSDNSYSCHAPLPSLVNNIKAGNSLIGSDFVSSTNHRLNTPAEPLQIHPFDWKSEFPAICKSGGFDAVIGNPPYVNIRHLTREHGEGVKDYFRTHYESATGGYDLYVLFLERAYHLLRPHGTWGVIIPNKIASLGYGASCRQLLLSRTTIHNIIDLSQSRTFSEANVYPYIIVGEKCPPALNHSISFQRVDSPSQLSSPCHTQSVRQSDLSAAGGLAVPASLPVEARVPTAPLAERARLHSGTTGFTAQRTANVLIEKADLADSPGFEFIVSGNIDRYCVALGNVRYLKRIYRQPVLPAAAPTLSANKRQLFAGPKIVIAGMSKRLEAALDPGGWALGVQVFAAAELQADPRYLLALLNSKLLSFLFRTRFPAKSLSGGYLAINKGQLAQLPIRILDLSRQRDKTRHAQLLSLVDQMHLLQAGEPSPPPLAPANARQSRITAIDQQIDRLVYQLYSLTSAEIAHVEQATPTSP